MFLTLIVDVQGPELRPPWLLGRRFLVPTATACKFPKDNLLKKHALCETRFAKANCGEAKFAKAKIAKATLAMAKCAETNFAKAKVAEAEIAKAEVANARFANATFAKATYADTKFAKADSPNNNNLQQHARCKATTLSQQLETLHVLKLALLTLTVL